MAHEPRFCGMASLCPRLGSLALSQSAPISPAASSRRADLSVLPVVALRDDSSLLVELGAGAVGFPHGVDGSDVGAAARQLDAMRRRRGGAAGRSGHAIAKRAHRDDGNRATRTVVLSASAVDREWMLCSAVVVGRSVGRPSRRVAAVWSVRPVRDARTHTESDARTCTCMECESVLAKQSPHTDDSEHERRLELHMSLCVNACVHGGTACGWPRLTRRRSNRSTSSRVAPCRSPRG